MRRILSCWNLLIREKKAELMKTRAIRMILIAGQIGHKKIGFQALKFQIRTRLPKICTARLARSKFTLRTEDQKNSFTKTSSKILVRKISKLVENQLLNAFKNIQNISKLRKEYEATLRTQKFALKFKNLKKLMRRSVLIQIKNAAKVQKHVIAFQLLKESYTKQKYFRALEFRSILARNKILFTELSYGLIS